jgi:activator of 2-hydroxyglutaryl-CoA dehydratase
MRETLERSLGRQVHVVPHAQITGALGAAIVAGREAA